MKRTPVNFPRMKVRGARNRKRSAERRVLRQEFRVMPRQTPHGVTLDVHPEGTHRAVFTQESGDTTACRV